MQHIGLLSLTISWSLPKFMSFKLLVIPSNNQESFILVEGSVQKRTETNTINYAQLIFDWSGKIVHYEKRAFLAIVLEQLDVSMLVAQSCPTLCDPMDWGLPGSSFHGVFQARILEWIAIPLSRGLSWPRDRTWVSRIAGRLFTVWATREDWISIGKKINFDPSFTRHIKMK